MALSEEEMAELMSRPVRGERELDSRLSRKDLQSLRAQLLRERPGGSERALNAWRKGAMEKEGEAVFDEYRGMTDRLSEGAETIETGEMNLGKLASAAPTALNFLTSKKNIPAMPALKGILRGGMELLEGPTDRELLTEALRARNGN